jgi:hypothetical protein
VYSVNGRENFDEVDFKAQSKATIRFLYVQEEREILRTTRVAGDRDIPTFHG